MRVKYFIISVLLVYLIASAIVACPSPEEIQLAREDREEAIRRSEISRQREAYFKELTEYCREHEDMYMEISEQVFHYLDEGLSIEDACVNMNNNAAPKQKEILEQTFLKYPTYKGNIEDSMFEELKGNGLYYFIRGGSAGIKAVYIHEYSEEVEEYITSMEYTTTIKINDHLYVCYTKIPYT